MQNVLTTVSFENLADAVESDLLLLFVIILGVARSLDIAPGEHEVLDAQVAITDALEDTTQLESPGNRVRAHEEVAHLAAITDNPGGQDGESEALARARSVVGEDLGHGEGGLDGKTNAAQQADIGAEVGDRGKVDDKEGGNEVA